MDAEHFETADENLLCLPVPRLVLKRLDAFVRDFGESAGVFWSGLDTADVQRLKIRTLAYCVYQDWT